MGVEHMQLIKVMYKNNEPSNCECNHIFHLKMVTNIQKSLHPLKKEALRWRGIVALRYEQASYHDIRSD
jgi:hypothetical protein